MKNKNTLNFEGRQNVLKEEVSSADRLAYCLYESTLEQMKILYYSMAVRNFEFISENKKTILGYSNPKAETVSREVSILKAQYRRIIQNIEALANENVFGMSISCDFETEAKSLFDKAVEAGFCGIAFRMLQILYNEEIVGKDNKFSNKEVEDNILKIFATYGKRVKLEGKEEKAATVRSYRQQVKDGMFGKEVAENLYNDDRMKDCMLKAYNCDRIVYKGQIVTAEKVNEYRNNKHTKGTIEF